MIQKIRLSIVLTSVVFSFTTPKPGQNLNAKDPLLSWKEGASKKAIIDFVERISKEGSPDFIPPPARIAVFDNHGTGIKMIFF